jgi:hypothetical protein
LKRTTPPQAAGILPLPVLAVIVLVLAGLTAGYFFYRRAAERTRDVPVLTQEAAAYLTQLELSDVDMKAAENYLGHTVVNITGKITNKGPRTLLLVEINCVFKDYAGQAAARERVAVVGRKTGAIPTGQTRAFELAFDNIPASWNQTLPDLVISQIQFQE